MEKREIEKVEGRRVKTEKREIEIERIGRQGEK